MQDSAPRVDIRPAAPGDERFVAALAGRVFSHFGNYETTLPARMPLPWIRTVMALTDGRLAGFAMYSEEDLAVREVDLLAIAVDPAQQSRGLGRRLLTHVEAATRRLIPHGEAAVRLTVAQDNAAARGLFETSGYVRVSGQEGLYPGGQSALTLRKAI